MKPLLSVVLLFASALLSGADTRTEKDSGETLSREATIAALGNAMNVQAEGKMLNLLHPKLRAFFKEEDLETRHFASLLVPSAKIEILPFSPEQEKAFDSALSALTKLVETRPTHELWIRTPKGDAAWFVAKIESSWFLVTNIPREFRDRKTPNQPLEPTR